PGQRGLRRVLRRRPARPHDDRRRRAAGRGADRDGRDRGAARLTSRAMAVPAHERIVEAADIARARAAVADVARQTPVLPSQTLSDVTGAAVALKAENLQRTGSFKIRGALNKLAALGDACARGVTAGSAGNHAWALAQAARVRGVPCEVFMPHGAPIAKVD